MALDMIIEGDTRINNKLTADEDEEGNMEEDNYMKTAKVKMEQVREENERLKLTLSRMMKDYQSLKMQLSNKIQQDHEFIKKPTDLAPMASSDDESELVSLSLGRSVSADSSRKHESSTESKNLENCKLELGLDLKSDFTQVSKDLKPGNSSNESKGEGNNDDIRSSEKSLKSSRSGDDEVLQYSSPLKKPRVSVRAVCNTQTMNDGCQWRKYGQKIAKGNPCPRAYYRCTVSSSCPVRKQVQRCIDDMTILTTTYEGTHNHPLPPSAATMASATSAAAAMLNCGSSASLPLLSTSTTPSRFGFNLPSSNNFITIASSQSHPTVILDLTTPNQNPSTLFPTSLNFSSFDPKNVGWQNKPNFLPYSQQCNDQKIANATKAITRDPTFQTALAAAITSFVGTNYHTTKGRDSGLNFNLNFSQPSTINGSVGCATSFMNKFPQSVNSQPMNATHFAPVTLSTSKSQAVSLADDGEEIILL